MRLKNTRNSSFVKIAVVICTSVFMWYFPTPFVPVVRKGDSLVYDHSLLSQENLSSVRQVLNSYQVWNKWAFGLLWVRWQLVCDRTLVWNYTEKANFGGVPKLQSIHRTTH